MIAEQVQKKVIIFDFDGVLRSVSWEGMYVAYIEIIKAKGKDPDDFFRDLKTFQGWFDPDWTKRMESVGGIYLDRTVTSALFHKHYDSYVQLFPWVEDLLTHLSGKYHLAILSSSSIHSVKEELGDVARFFPLIVGMETVTHLKPHPEGVYHILNHFGVKREQALIIGDTPHDISAGFAAGIWTGAVQWGLAPWDELKSLDAEMYFEDPIELFDL